MVTQPETVNIFHVKHGSGDVALNGFRRFDPTGAGIHLETAAPELALFTGNHPPIVVAALAVDLADHWNQVEQIVVRGVEHRIDLLAAGPTR